VLNCANNRLKKLNVSGLSRLQILDYSGNLGITVKASDCVALKDDDSTRR
jgi:Leucine-rich repeat (LRR) protein